jgi:hypothetical protein
VGGDGNGRTEDEKDDGKDTTGENGVDDNGDVTLQDEGPGLEE